MDQANYKSNHINSCKFSIYFARKNLFFLFYTSTFTKTSHQFIYSTHLFNKIFILFAFFIISFLLEQTHKLVFFVEPHPHLTSHPSTKSVEAHPHPSFNKITHTQLAIVFSVKLQTQHKPKITHTQPPTTINDQIEQTYRNHRCSLSQGLGSSDHGLPRKPVVFMWSEMREADWNHSSLKSQLYLIREADRLWERVDRWEWGDKGNEKKRVRWVSGWVRREKKKVIYKVNSNSAYMYSYCPFTWPWCTFAHFYKD